MKIEMVLPSLAPAGMETMVARMVRKLVGRGHDIGVTCLMEKGALAADLEAIGVPVALVPAPGLATNLFPLALTRHLSARAPQVLHIHSGVWLKAAMAGCQARLPYTIYTSHGLSNVEPWRDTWFWHAGALFTDRIVTVSEHLKDYFIGYGLPARKFSVIINGIDTRAFQPRSRTGTVRQRLGIKPDTCLVGTVARLEPVKNQSMMIEAIALARNAGTACELVLVGDGKLRGALSEQARALGVADSVHFWGHETDVADIYPDLDVFALTSLTEGTSISMLEAMASGICPVATAVGGNIDLLAGGACGTLVGSGRADELALVIAGLAANPDHRRTLAGKARIRVESRFSEDAMLAGYEALYRACPRRTSPHQPTTRA